MTNSFPYDLTLSDGTTTANLMLVTPQGQSKQLKMDEVPIPSGIYELRRLNNQDTVTHTDYGLQYDTAMSQADLSAGVGSLEFSDKVDERSYWWAQGIVSHVAGRTFLAPAVSSLSLGTTTSAAPTGFETYLTSSGTRYDFFWSSKYIYRRDATNGTNSWTLVYTQSNSKTITDFKVFNGVGLIAFPSETTTTSDFAVQTDVTAAATWSPTIENHTAFSNTLGKPKFWAAVRGTCYAFVDPNKVFYTTDPTSDGWTGPIDTSLADNVSGPPGDKTYTFTGTEAMNDYLMGFRQDAGYNIDAQQEVHEIIWEWKGRPQADNFKYATAGGGLLYFNVSPEVYAYDPTTGRILSLGLSLEDGFSVQSIAGIAADSRFVYVLAKVRVPTLRSDVSMALLRGWRDTVSTWYFEVLWEDTSSTSYGTLFASVLPNSGTRLYWGLTGGTAVKHMDLNPDWDNSTGSSFGTSGVLYASIWRTGFATFIKRWLWLSLYTENVSATNTIVVAYSTDNGATFTDLGTVTTEGQKFLAFSELNEPSIVLRFTLSGDGTGTPVLRVFDVHARVRFRYLHQAQATVRIADGIENRNGSRSPDTAATLKANIEALRASDSTIAYTDFLGNSFNVSVDHITYQPTHHEEPDNRYELEALLVLSEAGEGS